MTVEAVTFITDYDPTYPEAGDFGVEGDDHIRNMKIGSLGTWSAFIGEAVTVTEAELNKLDGFTGDATDLNKLDGFTGALADLNRLDVTTEGTAETSKVLTVSATDTLVCTGMTWTDLGTVTTVDINGGSIDGANIGAASAGTGAFTTLTAATTLGLASGTTVNEFSIDGTLADNSDDAVPTEKAIKTYVDAQIAAISSTLEELMQVRNEQTAGVEGGASVAATWTERVINTEVVNEITGASLAANLITLPAGTYRVEGWGQFSFSGTGSSYCQHRVRQRTGTPTTLVVGAKGVVATGGSTVIAPISGKFTLAAEQDIAFEYLTQKAQTTNGQGAGGGLTENSVFAELNIYKEP